MADVVQSVWPRATDLTAEESRFNSWLGKMLHHSLDAGSGVHPASSPCGTGGEVSFNPPPSVIEVKKGEPIPPLSIFLEGVMLN
jgi:hypothetical protein